MKLPPLWLRLRVLDEGRKKISLWVPLFIAGPIFMIICIFFFPFVFIAALYLWQDGKGKSLLMAVPMLIYLFFQAKGLKLDIKAGEEQIYLFIK
jgi:hypothetical protein